MSEDKFQPGDIVRAKYDRRILGRIKHRTDSSIETYMIIGEFGGWGLNKADKLDLVTDQAVLDGFGKT